MGCHRVKNQRPGGRLGAAPRTTHAVPVHLRGKPEAGMSTTGTAERRSIDRPDRGRTGFRHSDSPTFVQTHFRVGKYSERKRGGNGCAPFSSR